MSTSDLYSVYKTKTRHLTEFYNSYGTAPVLWGYLCKKYLGLESSAWLHGGDNYKKLWDLIYNEDVPRDIRLVHAFTFDHAICPNNKASELAECCFSVYQKTNIDISQVNHWGAIGYFLQCFKGLPRSRGIGLSCTSVSDNWISWDRIVRIEGDKSWDIFSEIDA